MKKFYTLLFSFVVGTSLFADNTPLVGDINISATVDQIGGASLTIPIEVPAGINGMQPNLSLVYNSHSGYGLAGWGWNLAGISSIQRTGKTIYHDNIVEGVMQNNTDNLMLDGERLLLKSGNNLQENSTYRTEHESFNLITKTGGEGFVIQSKNGNTSTYGDTYQSQLTYRTGLPKAWFLSKIMDRNGNFITYTYNYNRFSDINDTYISKIEYSGRNNTTPIASIEFEYEDIPHEHYAYDGDTRFSRSQILKSINIKSSGNLLYSYLLTYDNTDVHSKLISVMKVAANGDYYKPTRIIWNTANTSSEVTTNVSISRKNKLIYADFTGDGLIDIFSYEEEEENNNQSKDCVLYTNTSSENTVSFSSRSFTSNVALSKVKVLDYNGDGRKDLAGIYNDNRITYLIANGTTFTTTSEYINAPQKGFSVGDFDGDGCDEIIPVGINTMYKYNASPIPFTGINTWSNSAGRAFSMTSSNVPLDFNGNGKTDILIATDALCFIYEFNPSTSTFIQIGQKMWNDLVEGWVADATLSSKLHFGDFNGDCSTDLLYLGFESAQSTRMMVRVFVSKGGSLTEKFSQYVDGALEVFVNDFNHDGISDIAYLLNNNNVIHLYAGINNYDAFVLHDQTFDITPADFNTFMFEDIRGTGRADFVMFNSNNKIITKQVFKNNAMLVDKVTDGMGNTYDFTYKSIANSNIYTNNRIGANHIIPFVQPFYVVSDYTAPYTSLSFHYKNGRCHTQGKGFLGFEELTTTDNLNQIQKKDVSQLSSTYLFHYLTSTTETTLDGNQISRMVYNNAIREIGGKCIFPYVSRYEYTDNLTTLNETHTFAYDEYGNLDSETTIRGNWKEYSKYYYTNAKSWCPNRISNCYTYNTYDGETSPYRRMHYQYDVRGNMTHEIADTLEANYRLTTLYFHDAYGNVVRKTTSGSGLTLTSSYAYSDDGRFMLSSTDELGQQSTYTYDTDWGTLLSQTGVAGTTTHSYDTFGRLQQSTSPNGVVSTTSSQFVSDIPDVCYMIHETCTNTPPVTTYYNAAGKPLLKKSIGHNNRQIYTSYDYYPNGQDKRVSEPFFASNATVALSRTFTTDNATLYEYDVYRRLVSIENPEGTTRYIYNGLSSSVTTPATNRETKLNASGFTEYVAIHLTLAPLALPINPILTGKKVTYTYYPTGLVKSATPDGGSAVTMEYDIQGNRTKLVDPDAGTITNTYNAFGQVLSRSQSIHNNNPVVTTYTYNNTGQLSHETVRGEKTKHYTYGYHSTFKDKLLALSDNISTYIYTYDSYGNRTEHRKSDNTRSGVLRTSYDKNLIMQNQIPFRNLYDNYSYDDYGNMISEKFNSTTAWELLEQNARGQVVRERKGGIVTTYTYDNCGRVTSIVAPNVVNLHYTYDILGNVLTKTDAINNQTIEYGYDNYMRLRTWTINDDVTHTITYDATTGNISSKSDLGESTVFSYNNASKPHALISVNEVATDWGNMSMSYDYTDFGKVESVQQEDNCYEIFYGPDKERVRTQKTISGATTTRYYMPSHEIVVDSLGAETYIFYLCNGSIGIYDKATETRTLYHGYYDAQGSLIALTDNSGNVLARYAYDPWGGRVSPTDWTQSTTAPDVLGINRGYTMHEHLDEFDLINMNGRVYDPAVAQFLSPDPYIQDAGNWLNYNRYAYCYNNPTRYVDPDGEIITETLVFAGIMALFQGSVNLGMQMYKGNVNSFGDGAAAFSIGAVSGAASSLLGGVTYGLGGFLGGFVAGAQSSGIASFLQGLGNQYLLGDKELEPWEVVVSALSGGISIGITSGCFSYFGQNASFWNGKIKWPPNSGALDNTTEIVTLEPGTIVDRYGGLSPQSMFAGEHGTPIPARSLNLKTTDMTIYNEYLIVKPIENVEKAITAPWFDSPGGGIQYVFPEPISVLIEKGFIKVLK